MICPICKTKADKNQDYCLKCAWEFEYYFDELSKSSKTIYDNRFKIWSGIYNELSDFRKASESATLVPNKARLKPSFPFEPEMVLIKGGSFMMGSDDYSDEKPIHKVTIDYDFEVGKYPVTFEEYDYFCEETKRKKSNDRGWGRGKRPVIDVSWHDAKAYAKWLSEKTGKDYRLLTESEWEYVARAGTTTKWSFGDNKSDLEYYAWYNENSDNKSHEVGTKNPNPWGVYDMHGNVWEWCEDWYLDSYQKDNYRVIRGGSWSFDADSTRSADRYRDDPTYHSDDVGFRLQRTLPS
jgi:formylglycine-generating enzyme required for sulfatase activity